MKERLGLYTNPNTLKSWEQIMSNPIKGEISISETACPQALSFDQHITRLEGIIDLKKETGLWQNEVSKDIETTAPFFAFRPLSDIHFGAIGVDMKALKEHISDLHNLPIYTAICGDVADMFNPVKHPSGMLGDAITPDDQMSLVRTFFEEYKDRILATTQDPSHCFIGEELVFTPEGLEFIKDIKEGDIVCDRDGNPQKVTKNHINQAESIFSVKISKLPTYSVTGEHPLFISNKKSPKDARFVKVKDIDLSKSNYVLIPKNKPKQEEVILSFAEFTKKDTYHTSDPENRWNIQDVLLDDELSYFFGWYLAEGCASSYEKWKVGDRGAIRLTLSDKEVDEINELADIGKRKFGVIPSINKKHSSQDLCFSSVILGRAFKKWFNSGASEKKIPEFMYRASESNKLNFIKGYFMGDGCFNKKEGITASTASKKMAFGFIKLSLSMDKLLFSVSRDNASKRKPGMINGKQLVSLKDKYIIDSYHPYLLKFLGIDKQVKKMNYTEDDKYFYLKVQRISEKREKTEVFNLTTEDNTFLVPFIVHNTDWMQQVSGVEPQRWLTDKLNIPCLKSGGRFNLKINGIQYKGLLFHEIGKYKSGLNITNAGKRMLDMMDDVDFVISGHSHIGAYEKLVKRDKKPVISQMGTFKTDDDFGNRKGLSPKPQVFFPTLLFDTTKHNIEVIEDREAAQSIIRAYSK